MEKWLNVPAKKTDDDLLTVQQIKADGLPVVIFGAGEIAENCKDKLFALGVRDIYYAVSEGIAKPEGVYYPAEIDAQLPSYNLVPGFLSAILDTTGKFSASYEVFRNKQHVLFLSNIYELNSVDELTVEFFREHYDGYKWLYDVLADEKSKESYAAFLSAKLSNDYSGMSSLVELPQYFSGDFLNFDAEEVFVDCGAYDGDSIRDFVKVSNSRRRGGGVSYIYAFEPDTQNQEKLQAYVSSSGLVDITEIIPNAAYDKVTQLRFNARGNSTSNISDSGTITIPTETIDRIIRTHKVTFLKMDIEGAERHALIGAEQTIRKYHPTLAISAYHRHDDCLVLPELIRSFWEGYRFYFRLHKPIVYDAVLYAVP